MITEEMYLLAKQIVVNYEQQLNIADSDEFKCRLK
jgi:hypothetical protein